MINDDLLIAYIWMKQNVINQQHFELLVLPK